MADNEGSVEVVAAVQAVISVITVVINRRRRRRMQRWLNRRWWVRPWILRRDEGGRELHSLLNDELKTEDSDSYKNFLRMSDVEFKKLLGLVGPGITKKNTVMRESISASRRLILTLRFLATGESYRSLMFSFRIPQSTISEIIPETCKEIFNCLKDTYLKFPSTVDEWKEIAQQYQDRWNFPNCLGAMDGKHIEFRPPRSMGSYYFNYKGANSIVLFALVDAQYKFIFVDVGCNGRVSDGGVFRNSPLYGIVTENTQTFPPPENLPGTSTTVPFTIVADDAFPLHNHIMKPYKGTISQEERVFNYRLSRARRTSENAFGILSNRFRVLLKKIELRVETVELITLAACALHNFLLTNCNKSYVSNMEEREDTNECVVIPGEWHNNHLSGMNRSTMGVQRSCAEARKVRDTLREYFNTIGFVPWQWECVKNFRY